MRLLLGYGSISPGKLGLQLSNFLPLSARLGLAHLRLPLQLPAKNPYRRISPGHLVFLPLKLGLQLLDPRPISEPHIDRHTLILVR